MRRTALVLAVVVIASGCSGSLGRSVPSCDTNVVSSTLILEAQSMADTEYVPCVADLKAGWRYEHAEISSGSSRFWISSDRVGDRFLEVSLTATCDVDGAVRAASDEGLVPLYVDVRRSDVSVPVVVVPEGDDPESEAYAALVAQELRGAVLRDRDVRVRVDLSTDATGDRIDRALAAGNPVLVVGAREREDGVAELYLPERREPQRVVPAEALDEIGETLGDTRYEATWFYPFRSGCVTYEFDAKGPGVDTLPEDAQAALGLYPVDPLRAYGDRVGWVLP